MALLRVRSIQNVALLMEDGAFALFFPPHPGGFASSRVPTPGNLPSKAKKMLIPGGQPGGGLGTGGIDWCIITVRKEGDWGRGTYGWIFPKNRLAEFDFLSVFTSVSSALLPLLFNSKWSLRSTFAESCSICFTFKHPPSPPLQKDLSHAGYLVPDNNAKLPPEGFGTHSIEPFASLKVRTTSLINILQGKAWCKAVE